MNKILVEINVACNVMSTGRIAEQIGVKAKKHGWDVYMVHGGRYKGSSELKTYQIQSKWSDYKHFLWDSFICGRAGLGSTNETEGFLMFLDEIKPTVVHLHNIHGYFINYKLLLNYLAGRNIPVVWTMHDCWPITGHCAYFDSIDCQKWKSCCHNCELLRSYPKSLIRDTSKETYLLKKQLFSLMPNITLVPVSEWLGDITRQSMAKDHAKIRVIHNGIDINIFRPTSTKPKGGKFRILGVANGFSGRKGLHDFNKLREILPNNFEITMVGLIGAEIKQIKPGIKGYARTSTIEELVRLYNEADVYINPTYSDNFPTTNIEALACGTPVITYKTGGSPEAVDEKTGVVIEQGDVVGLAEAIKLMQEKPLSSFDCRKRAEDLFDKDKCFEKYVKLYEELLSIK